PAEQSSALGVIAHQWCRLGRKTDRNYDYLPIGSRLSRSKLAPGWRPAAPTRASPPLQAKNGLDGDPGVRAYVCVREIALNGSSEAGPFQSTVIGRVFQQSVSAFPRQTRGSAPTRRFPTRG